MEKYFSSSLTEQKEEKFIYLRCLILLLIPILFPLPLSRLSPSVSDGKGSALLLAQELDDPFCLKEGPGSFSASEISPRFTKPFADVDSILELKPKIALDINGIPGHAEAVDLAIDGGSRPSSLNPAEGSTETKSSWKVENPYSRLVQPFPRRKNLKGVQQNLLENASAVCSSNPYAVLQSDEDLYKEAPGVMDSHQATPVFCSSCKHSGHSISQCNAKKVFKPMGNIFPSMFPSRQGTSIPSESARGTEAASLGNSFAVLQNPKADDVLEAVANERKAHRSIGNSDLLEPSSALKMNLAGKIGLNAA
ncbi:hypothetical protein Nepgr_019556 [Nepenthes gracilis]|uniref:Uncharacterized protein n=1 Tax=Nepenthes gracilis TaxID=150966 RepID=A0AAD3XVC8_NEPGR|nr:hypothetical protein Nepgr_019556 [Nepenthes gracilis]